MPRPTPVPLIVVTGIHAASMAAVTVGLQWDLPRAVAVRHHIDPESATITRTVSDAGGVLEDEAIGLDHVCLTCALRQDILPTIERLARGRWESIVVHLPLAAEAGHLCRMIAADPRWHRLVRVAAVVAALRGGSLTGDLLGGARLAEIGTAMVPDDDRGVGEVLARQVEYADAVICVDGADQTARELLTTLARPGAGIHTEVFGPSGAELLTSRHDTARSEAWTATVRRGPLPPQIGRRVWRLDRVGAWLRLDETAVEVPARGSVVVGFTLDLPADAEPGDHAGGLVAVSTASSDDGPDVQYRVGTRAYVRVAGPVTARLGVQPEADFTADPLLVTPGSLTITAELANVGNVRLTPAVRATVSSLFGLWSQSVPLTEVGELLPGGTATSRTELTGVPPLGPLWIALDLPRAQSWGQEIGGEVAVESTIITVWAAPWAIPLGVLLTLAVGWLLWRRTKHGSLRGGQRVAVDHPVPERLEPRP